eukprot:CAMPEP_0173368532 /NCGR_PEP_ID=MMETSP1144-20121109/25548_1 /TAXON_ID=483371 /ORGANISM="non described non described, Strain CCMP2298" /LENGTH=452 /DNA_ID=CAMNT_0014319713 /DNA_START=44 /DNA_END=1399 /DNA_ORIENTATION=+
MSARSAASSAGALSSREPSFNELMSESYHEPNLEEDEDASREMEAFLAALDKNDLAEEIKREVKSKLQAVTSKLTTLFNKQRDLGQGEEEEVGAISTEALMRNPEDEDALKLNRKQEQQKILLLTKRLNAQTKTLELTEQKTRATTRQWTGDKELHLAEMARKDVEVHDMEVRLHVMEKKARTAEQVIRDRHMVNQGEEGEVEGDGGFEVMKERHDALVLNSASKKEELATLTQTLWDTKLELSSAGMKIDALTSRVEDLVKRGDSLHDQMESMEKEEGNHVKHTKKAIEESKRAQQELATEVLRSESLAAQLQKQQADLGKRMEGQVEQQRQIEELVGQLAVQKREAEEREAELAAEAKHLRIDRETSLRNCKKLKSVLGEVVSQCSTLTQSMQECETQMQGRLKREESRAREMQIDLANAVSNLGVSALRKGAVAVEFQSKHRVDMAEDG